MEAYKIITFIIGFVVGVLILKFLSDRRLRKEQEINDRINNIVDEIGEQIYSIREEEYDNNHIHDDLKEIKSQFNKETFKTHLEHIGSNLLENEEYLSLSIIKKLYDNRNSVFDNRLNWFNSRIGKRIIIENNACPCEECSKYKKEGLLLENEYHSYRMFVSELNQKANLNNVNFIDFTE